MTDREKEIIGKKIITKTMDRNDMAAFDNSRIYCNQIFVNRICSEEFSVDNIKRFMTISRHKDDKGKYYGLAGIIEDNDSYGTASVYHPEGKRLLTYDMIHELAMKVQESNYEKVADAIEYIRKKCNYELTVPGCGVSPGNYTGFTDNSDNYPTYLGIIANIQIKRSMERDKEVGDKIDKRLIEIHNNRDPKEASKFGGRPFIKDDE